MAHSPAPDQGRDITRDALYRRITLRLIPFIFICYLFNYLDRVNVGFAKLQMLDALKFIDILPHLALLGAGFRRKGGGFPTASAGVSRLLASMGSCCWRH